MIWTLQWLSLASAFAAAAFWFWSAMVRLPKKIVIGYGGGGTAQDLMDKFRAQGHISAAAATCSGLSVLFQAIASLLAGH